jgi:hypothetical protein
LYLSLSLSVSLSLSLCLSVCFTSLCVVQNKKILEVAPAAWHM